MGLNDGMDAALGRYEERGPNNMRDVMVTHRGPFPAQMRRALKYATDPVVLAFTASAVPQSVTYRANGAYDPEYAVGGHQPRYWDTLVGAGGSTAIYRRYRVVACGIKVTVQIAGNAAPAWLVIGARPSGIAGPLTVTDMMERPLYSRRPLAGGTGSGPLVMSRSWSVAGIFGISRQAVMSDDTFTADYNTTPASEALVDVIVFPSGATTSSYYVTVELVYQCVFDQLNDVLAS